MRPIHKNRELLEQFHYKKNLGTHKKRQLFVKAIRNAGVIAEWLLKITFLKERGRRNADDIVLNKVELELPTLPEEFDNFSILFLTDLHVEKLDSIVDNIIRVTSQINWDCCILGGDYMTWQSFDTKTSEEKMRRIVDSLKKKGQIFAVLGNHDKYKAAEMLNSFGVEMLLNENVCLQKNSEKINLVGVDDAFRYNADDLELAQEGIGADAFKILVSHSPQLYKEAAKAGVDLYLAGHTHGGQICLPGQITVVKAAAILRKMIKGRWKYNDMLGYTSPGCGCSGVGARFFCPPEVTLLKLRKNI